MQALSQLSYSPKRGAGRYVSDGIKSRNPDGRQTPERPCFPKQHQGLIDGGRNGPAGYRYSQRLSDFAEAQGPLSGKGLQ